MFSLAGGEYGCVLNCNPFPAWLSLVSWAKHPDCQCLVFLATADGSWDSSSLQHRTIRGTEMLWLWGHGYILRRRQKKYLDHVLKIWWWSTLTIEFSEVLLWVWFLENAEQPHSENLEGWWAHDLELEVIICLK